MTLDDIPKLNRVGKESGDAPASERMTRFSNLPVGPSGTLSNIGTRGLYVLTGQPKSLQLALDQEFAKGVVTSRARPDLRCD